MYGMYYYIIMILGMFLEPVFIKIINVLHIKKEAKYFQLFQILRTIVIVNIGMLIFRADTLGIAYDMFISCFRKANLDMLMNLGLSIQDIWVVVIGVVIVFISSLFKERNVHIRETVGKWHIVPRWSFYIVGLFIVIIFGAYGRGYDIVSFIYAQF